MSNLVFAGAPNRADEATLLAGGEVPGLPAANLQDRQITRPWRTDSTAAGKTWVRADFGQSRVVGAVALIRHNLTRSATWRIRISDEPQFKESKYDSGPLEVWPRIEEFGTLPWGVFQWGGLIAPETSADITVSAYHLLPQPVLGQYLRVELFDGQNPAGYLQAGRLVAGPVYQPSFNMQFGWSMGFEDPSTVTKSRGGQTWIDVQERYRVLRFTLAHLPETEAYNNVFDHLFRRKGVSGDVLVIPQPANLQQYHNQAIYGRLRTLEPITNPFHNSFDVSFEVEELI